MVNGYTAYPGTDHTGDDITQLPGAGLAGLAAACHANSDCVSFNWAPDGSLGWLKTGFTPTNLSAGSSVCYYVWSGTVSGTYSTSGFSNASACGFSPHHSSFITTYPALPGTLPAPRLPRGARLHHNPQHGPPRGQHHAPAQHLHVRPGHRLHGHTRLRVVQLEAGWKLGLPQVGDIRQPGH